MRPSPPWILRICLFKVLESKKYLLQDSHLWSLWPSWTVWICVFKCPAWEKYLPQESHLWSLWPSWIVWMWLLKTPAWANDLQQDSQLWIFLFLWSGFRCLAIDKLLILMFVLQMIDWIFKTNVIVSSIFYALPSEYLLVMFIQSLFLF